MSEPSPVPNSMADLATRCDRLTISHLHIVARGIAAMKDSRDFVVHGLAIEVLRFYMGDRWTNENVFSIHPEVSRQHREGRSFLRTDDGDYDAQLRHVQRVSDLASLLLNLQDVEGFRERLSVLRSTTIEDVFGELVCASIVAHPTLQLRFRTPTGVKGNDHDAQITAPGGRVICCEMKTKLETTMFTERGLRRTLDKARGQLPADRPGVVLLRIPEHWPADDIEGVLPSVIRGVFRSSNRLVGVVVSWECWRPATDGRAILSLFRFDQNSRSSLYGADIDALSRTLGRSNNPVWIRLRRVVDDALGRTATSPSPQGERG